MSKDRFPPRRKYLIRETNLEPRFERNYIKDQESGE